MTLAQFLKMVDLYGADLARWPDPSRAPAADLLARSPEARRALDEAARFDRLLDLVADPVRPDQIARSLAGALAAIARPPARRPGLWAPLAPWWPRAAAMAAAVAIGFILGMTLPDARDDGHSLDLTGVRSYAATMFASPS